MTMKQGIPNSKYNQWRIVVLEEGTRFMKKQTGFGHRFKFRRVTFSRENKNRRDSVRPEANSRSATGITCVLKSESHDSVRRTS